MSDQAIQPSVAPITSYQALQQLALLANGRSGADIERLVREVRQKARRERRTMRWADLEQALCADHRTMSQDKRWRVAIHEAGHAIALTAFGLGEVQTISVGTAAAGHVVTNGYEDISKTEDWLMKTLASVLAGRTAELIVFGEPTTGAGGHPESDLAKATDFAVAAETRLGFSRHQPLVYHHDRTGIDPISLDRQLAERVNVRLVAAEAIARELLDERKDVLIAVASQVTRLGVMSGDDVRRLIDERAVGASEVSRHDLE